MQVEFSFTYVSGHDDVNVWVENCGYSLVVICSNLRKLLHDGKRTPVYSRGQVVIRVERGESHLGWDAALDQMSDCV